MDPSDLDYVEEACSVYCTGPVLEAVQLAGIFDDGKTFVDMPMLEVRCCPGCSCAKEQKGR